MNQPATTPRPATDKQLAYLRSLLRDRDVSSIGQTASEVLAQFDAMTSREASSLIELLKDAPRAARTAAHHAAPSVEAGRYAVIDTETGDVSFYLVDCPTQGRWAGRTFVSQLSGDNRTPIKDAAARRDALGAIAAAPHDALARYGQLIGACGACNRTLTDEVSRQRGIGPECARKRSL
jgi:hypothetical protein